MSNSRKNIYKKLYEVQNSIGAISKDSKNPFFKSKYFDINKLVKHCQPLLSSNGLLLLQPIEDNKVITKIIDVETGDEVSSFMDLPKISDPQKAGSIITYYRRYTLQSLLGLQAKDDDANSYNEGQKQALNKEIEDSLKMNENEFSDCQNMEDAKVLAIAIRKEYSEKGMYTEYVSTRLSSMFKNTENRLK